MANAVLQYSYTVHSLSNTYRGKLELPGGIQRAPARATCNIVLPKREVVRHGVKGAFHHHALASDDAWSAHHGSHETRLTTTNHSPRLCALGQALGSFPILIRPSGCKFAGTTHILPLASQQ